MADLEPCHALYLETGWADPALSESANRDRRRAWLEWTVRSYDELLALTQPPYGERAVTLRGTDEFIGLVGLVPLLAPFGQLPAFGGTARAKFDPAVGMFWSIRPAQQRRGYASRGSRRARRLGIRESQSRPACRRYRPQQCSLDRGDAPARHDDRSKSLCRPTVVSGRRHSGRATRECGIDCTLTMFGLQTALHCCWRRVPGRWISLRLLLKLAFARAAPFGACAGDARVRACQRVAAWHAALAAVGQGGAVREARDDAAPPFLAGFGAFHLGAIDVAMRGREIVRGRSAHRHRLVRRNRASRHHRQSGDDQ